MRVVLSMRADFLDRLAGHKHFLAELSRGLFFLTAPDHDNLRETLVRPAELAGYTFEDPWIVEDMMQAATSTRRAAAAVSSPRRGCGTRAIARAQAAHDRARTTRWAASAVRSRATPIEVAAAVPPQSQMLLRAIMTRLVTPEGTRAVVDHNELLVAVERSRARSSASSTSSCARA